MPRTRRTLLHTSDLHLDNHFDPDRPSAAQTALCRIVDHCREEQVDLLLIAGDLFDHNRVGAAVIDFACEQLARLHCPAVLIPGNHDCYTEQSVYRRMDLAAIGDSVHLLSEERGERLHLSELGMHFWGRGIVDHHPDHRPLERTPQRANDDWHIGLAHGYFDQRGGTAFSSLISAAEIAAADFDYLALGHVHVFADVSCGNTRAAYSGSPNRGPAGAAGTCALVRLDPVEGVAVKALAI